MSQLNLSFFKNRNFSVYYFLKVLDNYVIRMLKNIKPSDILPEHLPMEVKYFLNSKRKNLVNWIDFDSEAEVLVVNDVFGIISDFLCEKVKKVTLIEFSMVIADITNSRLEHRDNLDVIVGLLQDIKFEKKYDYIFLTDVLEFTKLFFDADFSFKDCINFFKSLLKPNGKLILNTSNQFGIKNWAGANEEFFGKIYGSLKNYSQTPIKLFSQKELEDLFQECGFKVVKTYFPIPTHYAPEKVIESGTIVEKDISKCYQDYSLHKNNLFFNERLLMEDIISNDKFYLFANSYLVMGQKGDSYE